MTSVSPARTSASASCSSATIFFGGRPRWLTVWHSARPGGESGANECTVKLRSRPIIAAVSRRLAISCSASIWACTAGRRTTRSNTLRKPSVANERVMDIEKESTMSSRCCSGVSSSPSTLGSR